MEKKKNNIANLERSKTLFLTIGLISAFALMAFAFNWQSDKIVDLTEENDGGVIIDGPPITIPDPIKPEPINPDKKKVLLDIISMVPNEKEIDTFEVIIPTDIDAPDFIKIPDPLDTTFAYVRQMPEFPGGELALRRFIAANVEYPTLARENGIQGTISLRFEVTKTGNIGKVEIYNVNSDALLQEAAIDVIRRLPNFKPGMQNGENVNVWYQLPISFKLN